jgi:hypothetical protein
MKKMVASVGALFVGVAMLACGAGCTAAVGDGDTAEQTSATSQSPDSMLAPKRAAVTDPEERALRGGVEDIGAVGPRDQALSPAQQKAPVVPVPVPPFQPEPAPWSQR